MTTVAAARWTTPEAVRAQVRRRWADGTLLRAWAAGEPFPRLELTVRGPKAGEIGDDLAAVRRWVAELEAGSRGGRCYDLVHVAIGGRHFGRNQVPGKVLVSSYEQAWRLLGVREEVAALGRALEVTAGEPGVRGWVAANPLQALEIAGEWERVVAAYGWLDRARGSRRYLREIAAPGVDTKFVERHRPVLAQLLGVPRTAAGFVDGLGLRAKPETLRVRFAPGWLGLPECLSEATFRPGELASVRTAVQTAVIIENEATFLSVPVPSEGIVLWGKGFEVGRAGSLPWLRGAAVHYWGDLDSHGFAILDQLRAWLPHTRSFLMDRQTLLAHRDRWVRDPSPTSAALPRLDRDEAALYADLVADNLGDAVRLEQELVGWDWVTQRLPYG